MEFRKLLVPCEHPSPAIKIDNPPVLTRITYDGGVSRVCPKTEFFIARVCATFRCERDRETEADIFFSISPIQSLIPVYPSPFKFSSLES